MIKLIYNKKYPCPTDAHAILIAKNYRTFKECALMRWQRDLVFKGLNSLDNARLRLDTNGRVATPIVSIKVDLNNQDDLVLRMYGAFFSVYHSLRDEVLELFRNLNSLWAIHPQSVKMQREIREKIRMDLTKIDILIYLMGDYQKSQEMPVLILDLLSSWDNDKDFLLKASNIEAWGSFSFRHMAKRFQAFHHHVRMLENLPPDERGG